jgi:hypothetical protein
VSEVDALAGDGLGEAAVADVGELHFFGDVGRLLP